VATNYQRGRAFEYRTRDKALKLGASYVMRAASSKGAADLIVLWPSTLVPDIDMRLRPLERVNVWLVQCKRDGRLPRIEREELIALGFETGAIPVLAKVGKNGRGVEFVFLNEQEC
jgi:hypothetical protein